MAEFNVDDLIEQGLVKKKTYTEGKYKGLSILKYTKKVFWDNLWSVDERLLECRGLVVDEDDNIIVRPFKKVFNLGENGVTVDPERMVEIPTKINGFLGCATMTEKYGLIISTTGTLDSEYSDLARKWIEPLTTDMMLTGYTHMFEICDNSDPHIVYEDEGAYLIGIRSTNSGELSSEWVLDHMARLLHCHRPSVGLMKFKDIPETNKEGYMILCAKTGVVLCKLKSPHYLSKKAFLRMGRKRIDLAFDNPTEFKKQIDEEFYDFHQYLLDGYTKEVYYSFSENERRQLIEDYFNEK